LFLGCGFDLNRDKDADNNELDKTAKTIEFLEGKDYIALAIAALETLFLPLVILVVVIIVVVLLTR